MTFYIWVIGLVLTVLWLITRSQGKPEKCDCCGELLKQYLFAKKVVGFFCPKCVKEYISCEYTGNERGAVHVMYKRALYVTRDPGWMKRPRVVYNNLNNVNENTLKIGDHIKWGSRHTFHAIVVSPIDAEGKFCVIEFSSKTVKKVNFKTLNIHSNHSLRLQLATYNATNDMKMDDARIVLARAYALYRCIIHCISIPEDRNAPEKKALFCKFGVRMKLIEDGKTSFFVRSACY